MINFRQITMADRACVNQFLSASNFRSAEYSFANIYNWTKAYAIEIAFFEGFLLFRSGKGEKNYVYPAGSGNLAPALQALIDEAAEAGRPFVLRAVQPEGKQLMEQLFPGRFKYTLMRDTFDYIYLSDDLINLTGKKFQPKRNHIARFKKGFNWQYEDITAANLPECEAMNEEWCRIYGCNDNASLAAEACAVRCALHHFNDEALVGGLLRVDGKVIAYTVGEQLNTDTLIVHVEKAFSEVYQGAYQLINQEFVKRHAANLKYVNREDDAGDEGLRKAKLSYQPIFLIEKYMAELS